MYIKQRGKLVFVVIQGNADLERRAFTHVALPNPQRLPGKDSPLPTVNFVSYSLLHKLIPSNLGQDDRPDKPVDSASTKDSESYHAVDVIRQVLVGVLALLGRHKGGDDEIDVAEKEEDDDGKGG